MAQKLFKSRMRRRSRDVACASAGADETQPHTARSVKRSKGSGITMPDEFSSGSLRAAARSSLNDLIGSTSSVVERILKGGVITNLTDHGASWIYHIPNWYKRVYEATIGDEQQSYRSWFEEVWDIRPKHQDAITMFGKEVLLPRFQQVYGQRYRFSGKTFEAEPFPQQLIHAVRCMQDLVVHPATHTTYLKAGLVNWYANGDHYMGPHSDDESNIHHQSPVFSLSLGAARRFVFTPRSGKPGSDAAKKLELTLSDGDLLVMGGTTQTTHKHALPKMKKCLDKRISITLRCFK